MAAAADAAGRQVRGAAALPPPSGAYSRAAAPSTASRSRPPPQRSRPAPPAGGVGLALSPCRGGGGEGGGALAWQPAAGGGVPRPGWGLCWDGVAEGRGLGGGGDRESSASGV